MTIPYLNEVDVQGKRLLVRADLNVPMDGNKVTDASRIHRFAEGMKPLMQKGARLVVLTHYGRPEAGQLDPAYSVDKLRPALSEALGMTVRFSDSCAADSARILSEQLADGEVLLCENLRYNKGETDNDPKFAAQLAKLGDIYVNDAFSCAHRAHASTHAITQFLPSYAGPLMMEEMSALQDALESPEHPAMAIVGGAKVSTKIAVLTNLVGKLDHVIIGGGMANTFLFAQGHPMGKSLHEADQLDVVKQIYELAEQSGCQIHLPEDVVVAKEFAAHAAHQIVPQDQCSEDGLILDAGPKAVERFQDVLGQCKTILWNGPLGAFELRPFDQATNMLAHTAAQLTGLGRVTSVAGGGDTVAALNTAGVAEEFTYVSSAGGAFLEWLKGKTLPGIAALQQANNAA